MLVIAVFQGFPVAGSFLADSILADIIDYDEFLTASRSEATYFMFKSFLPKIVQIPTSALPLAFMATVGYLPHVNGQPQEQHLGVQLYMKFIVVLCFASAVIAFYIKRKYPMKTDAHLRELTVGIAAHREGRPYPDPITGMPYKPLQVEEDEEETVSLLYHFKLSRLGSSFICRNEDVRRISCSQRSNTMNASQGVESQRGQDFTKPSSSSLPSSRSLAIGDSIDGVVLDISKQSSASVISTIASDFFVDTADGTQALTESTNLQLRACIVSLLLSLAGACLTMPLIENETWQFVPTLSVIFVGLCTTMTLFACLRKRAADRLLQLSRQGSLCNDLITRVLWHRAIVAEVGVQQDLENDGAKRASSFQSTVKGARSVRSLADVLTVQSVRSTPQRPVHSPDDGIEQCA